MKTRLIKTNKGFLWCCAALAGLQFSAWGATLTNRYSFTTDVSDSVGGKNGSLVNATISGNQAVLANPPPITSGDITGQYVALPSNLITGYTAITMEAWVTPTHDDATGGAFWNRLWDFGNSDGVNGVVPFMWLRTGNTTIGVRGDIVSATGAPTISAGVLTGGQENHVVWTSDGVSQRGRIYVNGVLSGANDGVNVTPANMGSTTNDWLGRSQFGGDRYFNGTINEFRIYSGELTPLEVAADYQVGPDTANASPGTVTNLQLQIPSPIAIDSTVNSIVLAQASGLTNTINVADSATAVTFTSSNPAKAAVSAVGKVTGVAVGSANIIATLGSVSVTQAVSVIAVPTTMKHRYSFTADATDSIGGANGTLNGGAVISGGKVVLDGIPGSWVDLPANLINPTNVINGAVTFESWFTTYPVNGAHTRLFDFGNSSGANGDNYIFLSPNDAANGGICRVAVSDANPGFNGEDGVNVANLLGRTNLYLTVVYNPNPGHTNLSLYLNGNIAGSVLTTKPLSSINNVLSYLGRSTYSGDSWLNGDIDEFRLYDGELDRFQIAASFQSGPNTPNFNVGAFVSFNLNVGSSTIPINQLRQSSAIMNFAAAPNVNLIGDANLTLTSSDPNILTIRSPGGVIRAKTLGTATLKEVYRYVTGATTTFYTNSQSLTVVTPPGTLVHRYSFTADANDSVGTANGTLQGGATIGGGQVTLDGTSGYVSLPAGIVSALTSNATFETWFTDNNSGGWARVWDFGSGPGAANIFLARALPGGSLPRFDWSQGNIDSSTSVTNGVQAHIVVMYDDADNASEIYLNGLLVASSANSGLALSSINDTNNSLGRSQYADPFLNASINEFRIYSGLLTAAHIMADSALGPDQFIGTTTNVSLTVTRSGGNLIIKWPTSSALVALMSSPALGAGAVWSPVNSVPTIVGGNYQATVPISGSAQYFRLQQ